MPHHTKKERKKNANRARKIPKDVAKGIKRIGTHKGPPAKPKPLPPHKGPTPKPKLMPLPLRKKKPKKKKKP